MSAKCRRYFYINNNKQRVTVTVQNGVSNIETTTIVEHITTDNIGYTTATHAVFQDYYSSLKLGERVKRVTKKVLQHWETVAQQVYEMNLPKIQQMYPQQ